MSNVRSNPCNCVIACAPQPISPTVSDSGFARILLAIADAAPVLKAVRKVQSAIPMRWPVVVS